MHKILEILRKQNEVTEMKIIDNPFDFGRCDVVDKNNKSLFKGGRIACQLFINRKFDEIISEGATEGVDKEGKKDSSPMAQMPCSRTSRPTR